MRVPAVSTNAPVVLSLVNVVVLFVTVKGRAVFNPLKEVTPPADADKSNTPVIVCPFPSKLPLLKLKVRVAPIAKASASFVVPPTPVKAIGMSNVLPLEVTIWVPEVAAKRYPSDDEACVIFDESVRLPKIVKSEEG